MKRLQLVLLQLVLVMRLLLVVQEPLQLVMLHKPQVIKQLL
ncbi:hypothetical protein [Synechococcus sp. UW140]